MARLTRLRPGKRYEYTVEAWADTFRGWQREFRTKFEAGVSALTAEALEAWVHKEFDRSGALFVGGLR